MLLNNIFFFVEMRIAKNQALERIPRDVCFWLRNKYVFDDVT